MYKLIRRRRRARRRRACSCWAAASILREVIAAAELLKNDWGVTADVWSCPSFNELRRDGRAVARWNMLHPTEKQRVS